MKKTGRRPERQGLEGGKSSGGDYSDSSELSALTSDLSDPSRVDIGTTRARGEKAEEPDLEGERDSHDKVPDDAGSNIPSSDGHADDEGAEEETRRRRLGGGRLGRGRPDHEWRDLVRGTKDGRILLL